jgi:hypothetical protein
MVAPALQPPGSPFLPPHIPPWGEVILALPQACFLSLPVLGPPHLPSLTASGLLMGPPKVSRVSGPGGCLYLGERHPWRACVATEGTDNPK